MRSRLLWLVGACVLPTIVYSAFLIYSNYKLQKESVYSESILLARKVSAELDLEFAAIESGLKILASSEHLASGDMRRFHEQARQAVKSQIVYNYILTDPLGRQVVNTLVPYGTPLPQQGTPPQLARVFEEERTVLTDLFVGPVVKRKVIAMGVPVHLNGRVAYSLNIGLDPNKLQGLLKRQDFPADWLLVILDSAGTIVARSRAADEFVGMKAVPAVVEKILSDREASIETVTREGIPAVASHHRSERTNWTVAVGVPRALLSASLEGSLQRLALWGSAMLASGLVLAWWLANRILAYARSLNNAARAVAQGEVVVGPVVSLREFAAVDEALAQASRSMREAQHLAYHDTLTGLANRQMLFEMAATQLATARRAGGGLAVMALDLDNFKQVNDSDGHAAGDKLLREVAARLQRIVRESDVAARLGGDEFVVVSACATPAHAAELAGRLVVELAQPYTGIAHPVSASIGVACFPEHGASIEDLLRAADLALYEAKRQGKARVVVTPSAAP